MSDPSLPWTAGQQQNPYGAPPPPPPPPHQQPYPLQPPLPGYAPHGYQPVLPTAYGRDPDRRPGTVTAAAAIAIAMSGLVLVVGVCIAVVGAIGSETFIDSFRDGSGGAYDDVNDSQIASALQVVGVGISAWSLTAIVLAVFVLRRSNAARVLLVICSVVTALVSLIAILSGVAVITLIGAITVVVLLFVGGANDWFHRQVAQVAPVAPPW